MYHGWDGGNIGAPIPRMVERVKGWLAEGQDVRIFTARISPVGRPAPCDQDIVGQLLLIYNWCLANLGKVLPVTYQKDFSMIELWDDRAYRVVPNTGMTPEEATCAASVPHTAHTTV